MRTTQPVGPTTVGSFPEGIVGQVKDHEDWLTVLEKKVEGCQERLKELQHTVEQNQERGLEGAEAPSPEAPCFASPEAYATHAPEVQDLRPLLHEHHHDPRAYVTPSPRRTRTSHPRCNPPPPPLTKHSQGQKNNGHTGSSCLGKSVLACNCDTKKILHIENLPVPHTKHNSHKHGISQSPPTSHEAKFCMVFV